MARITIPDEIAVWTTSKKFASFLHRSASGTNTGTSSGESDRRPGTRRFWRPMNRKSNG